MSGFRKAKAEQAALKMGVYGPPGSGKTFTTLLLLEGLALHSGKRVAYVDTEHGTDFYAEYVPERKIHPQAFDFDALYTRSLTEVLRECQKLDPSVYCGVALDSITHLWEAAIAAYGGNKTRAGTIPMHAWGGIKKPYKELMHWALNTPLHVFILGRQGNEYGEDDQGELKNVGVKMKAEGETAYEPHVLLRMEAHKPAPARGKRPDTHAGAVPTAFVEKDRSGVLFGQLIPWPNFDNIARPLLHLLGGTQAQQASDEETAATDAEALADSERRKEGRSMQLLEELRGRFLLAKDRDAVAEVEKSIDAAVKRQLLTVHLNELREVCQQARQRAANPCS